MRALLIEDDMAMAQSIALMLQQEAISAEMVDLGEAGIEKAAAGSYDVILLDLTLPDMTGYEVLRSIRLANIATPVLILSGLNAIQDKVRGLGFGADDYLTKPFFKEELIARLRAIHRRSGADVPETISIGNLTIHLDEQNASINGKRLGLTNKEYQILELLGQRLGSTITKEMMLNHLYAGMDEPELKIIDVFVCKIRKKLVQASGGLDYIETVWGRGYMLREPRPKLAVAG